MNTKTSPEYAKGWKCGHADAHSKLGFIPMKTKATQRGYHDGYHWAKTHKTHKTAKDND